MSGELAHAITTLLSQLVHDGESLKLEQLGRVVTAATTACRHRVRAKVAEAAGNSEAAAFEDGLARNHLRVVDGHLAELRE